MFYRVLETAGDYRAGDVLDLGDAELAAQLGRRVPLLKLAGRPEPQPVNVPALSTPPPPPAPSTLAPVAVVKRKPAKRGKAKP